MEAEREMRREDPEMGMSIFCMMGKADMHSALITSTSLRELPSSVVCIPEAIPRLLFLMEGRLDGALKSRQSLICPFQGLGQMGS